MFPHIGTDIESARRGCIQDFAIRRSADGRYATVDAYFEWNCILTLATKTRGAEERAPAGVH